jgi:cation diffusion facilitator CzcD-associated flavoprotein CzcO
VTASRPGDDALLPVLIIGSGFAGLGAAVKLKEAGIDDFVILERASGLGGTWRDNTYPGCACDVQSHLYSFSFAPNPGWSRLYAPQAEILAYLEACAERYGLRPHLRFDAEVIEARYDEAGARWVVKTRGGQRFHARAVIAGMGGLSNPSIPELPGTFEGPAFHSARWDHSVCLEGKRVAVVGSAASAVQLVPAIAPTVARLDLYQRTPSWVLPKADRPLAAWERRLFAAWPWTQRLARALISALLEIRVLVFTRLTALMALVAWQVRKAIDRSISDARRRALVTPHYTPGCKRLLLSNDWYPALARRNVEVIDTPIRELARHGVVTADGTLREVDVIVYATGFKVQEPVPRGTFFGVGGVDLVEAWREGPEAYLGISVAGFPNLFFLMGPNTALGHSSVLLMIEAQLAYVLAALGTLKQTGAQTLDVKAEVQHRYVDELQRALSHTVWASGCRSWYLNQSGRNTALWPGSTFSYRRRTRAFCPADYQLKTGGAS